jgi:thiosulfate dehydrogenase [quinone] large subunit
MSNGTWITLLIRFSMGIIFFAHGLGKVLTFPKSPEGIVEGFVETWLPNFVVTPFAYGLPFVELLIGILLLIGYKYLPTLMATGIILAILSFGKVVQGQPQGVAPNLTYLLVVVVGIYFADSNRWKLGK